MKLILILLIAGVACTLAAPANQQEHQQAESLSKAKRGLSLGLGYHAPLVTHSHYVAPAVVHHAPLISHAPLIAHAPLISHAPLIAHPVSYHLPTYHSIHHFK
ncbi:uncharacterized protein LOC115619975 [Scaptodrosophila lebanonensis]|uniref:Uncharacterized protein LOC115619975 n=1 Tax=Drosophila lebanonensis TaxID=7225 RepID=A0A6J2T0T3_DROLE|nr:uncharacterized protein LOC115619975 [Scaptodrosophila lebanonensis]